MALINTTFYAVNKNNGSTANSKGFSNNSITNITNLSYATNADRLTDAHLIWGQSFDGTQDIAGSFLLSEPNAQMTVYAPFKAGSYYAPEVSFILFSPTANASEHSKFYFRRTDVDMQDSPIHMWSNDNSNILNLDTSGILHRISNKQVTLNANELNWNGDALIHSDGELTISA